MRGALRERLPERHRRALRRGERDRGGPGRGVALAERRLELAKLRGERGGDDAVAGVVRVDAVADVGRLRGGLRRLVGVDERQGTLRRERALPRREIAADDLLADREGVLLHEGRDADHDGGRRFEREEVVNELRVVALHARAAVRVPVDGLAVVRAEHEEDDVGLGGLRLFELGRLAVAHAALAVPLLAFVERRAGVLGGVALRAAVGGAVAVGDAVADAGDDERVGWFAGEGCAGGERGAEGEETVCFHVRGLLGLCGGLGPTRRGRSGRRRRRSGPSPRSSFRRRRAGAARCRRSGRASSRRP